MNNLPAMTEEQQAELIQACRDTLRYADDYPEVEVRMARVAMAALTAKPVGYFEHHVDEDGDETDHPLHTDQICESSFPLFTAQPAPVLCSPAYHDEAKRLAELHGTSFVVFCRGKAPAVADPTRVFIGFTDKGLGHDTTGGQQ